MRRGIYYEIYILQTFSLHNNFTIYMIFFIIILSRLNAFFFFFLFLDNFIFYYIYLFICIAEFSIKGTQT